MFYEIQKLEKSLILWSNDTSLETQNQIEKIKNLLLLQQNYVNAEKEPHAVKSSDSLRC